VSVVTAVRDGARFLPEALESVLGQTLEDFELIVVDDGSRDRTPEVLEEFARRDPRVRTARTGGAGPASARNRAARQARGSFLAVLDGDDVALPTRLELEVAYLQAHPGVVAVGGAAEIIDDRGVRLSVIGYPQDPSEVRRRLESARSPVVHSAATIRAASFRAIGGYRPVLDGAEDYDLWLRLSSLGQITNLDELVVRYRLHGGQTSAANFGRTARATCAALASARIRASGRPDPVEGAKDLDDDLLRRLEVTDEAVAAGEVDYALWLARTLTVGGRRDLAAGFWSYARRRAPRTASARLTTARVLRDRADASASGRSVVPRVLASLLDPQGVIARRRQRPAAADERA
jgi:glycosyltransferase involved in cell wall biosynthesis